MTDSWTTHYKGTVGGRDVEVKTSSEGVYRVSTTQAEDYPGSVSTDETSTIIIPPSAKGTPVNINGETLDAIRSDLAVEGFNSQQIDEIVAHFPS